MVKSQELEACVRTIDTLRALGARKCTHLEQPSREFLSIQRGAPILVHHLEDILNGIYAALHRLFDETNLFHHDPRDINAIILSKVIGYAWQVEVQWVLSRLR